MRILVAEDEHRIANTIKKGLELEKFAVDVVYDGEKAYEMATSEDYDLILMDILIPKMNGVEVCTNLRKEGYHTPILMLTAKSQIKDKVDGLNAGADDYLTKPFSFEELTARIRALIRRPKNTLNQTLRIDDLELASDDFLVKRQGILISLSNKEFALLEFLMRNAGKIITKDQIIVHVWNYDADILPNTVEVNIKNIRNKIDKPFKRNLIHTVRGFGYKIE